MKKELTNDQEHYLKGYFESKIESLSISLGIPSVVLAERVAELLHPEGVGGFNRVSSMPQTPSGQHKVVGRKMEVGKRTSNGKTWTSGVKSSKQAAYWARMSPEERLAEVRRRMKKARANAKTQ